MASKEPNKLTITYNNNDPNQTKFQNNFLYKALILTLFLVILPILPSQAPEFISNQSWELLHLLFVGIAISYGLFSRRNDEPEPEPDKEHRKDNHDQSYVSRFLHVSSVFDDEPDSPSAEDDNSKVQTWSSKYHRKDHVDRVVTVEKPLLLPVRSLKETSAVPAKTTTGKVKESGGGVVLPSPIPWRSRSGRFEMREEQETTKAESSSASRFSQAESVSESQAKISEDFLRKRKSNKSNPPPPPPPPPPFVTVKTFPAEKSVKRFEFEKKMAMDQSPGKSLGDFNQLLEEEERGGGDFFDKAFLESDMDETESENDENIVVRSSVQSDKNGCELKDEESGSVSSVKGDLGPDVDKKADEFIAKFREQIRLQRIESIKRSSAQMRKKLSR